MKLFQDKNRNRFFIKHLTISFIVIAIFLAVVLFVWYPSPLAVAMGLIPMLAMMVAIDVFVGPIFGFIVYKTGKKTLKMDLAVIIVIQLSAFCYGAYSVAKSRPVWMVYHGGAYTVVRAVDAKGDDMSSGWVGPKFVAYQPERPTLFTQHDGDIFHSSNYGDIQKVSIKGLPFVVLEKFNEKSQIDAVLSRYPEATSWSGLATATGGQDLVILIDDNKNQIVDIVQLRPWN